MTITLKIALMTTSIFIFIGLIYYCPFWENKNHDYNTVWNKIRDIEDIKEVEAGVIYSTQERTTWADSEYFPTNARLTGGWARIYYKEKSIHYVEINYDEYCKDDRDWKQRPAYKIREVAIMKALEEIYPN
jgi:hypothetical protein